MTRFLSAVLEAREPQFRQGLQRLEVANGRPNTDIRLTADVMSATRAKLMQLGLDPKDTTAKELYHVLEAKLAEGDKRLSQTLRTRAATYVSAEGNLIDGMVHALQTLPDSKRCFAMKPSVMKGLLKKQPPKKAMKRLGYRSVDSLLKHETVVTVMAVAWLTEGVTWQHKLLDQYKKLTPSDFEVRNINIMRLQCKRWPNMAEDIVGRTKHNLLPFKELGAVVLLPFPADVPKGAATASLALALNVINEIRATSTFLKLSQVRADFGATVRNIAVSEPQLTSQLLDQPVSWSLIQRYYARLSHFFREEVFEPHVQLEDMVWQPIEHAMSSIEPHLAFWEDSAHLALLHNHEAVSFNLLDAAVNYCNQLPFESRVSQFFKTALRHELLLGYLHHDTVEQSVLHEVQPEFATELVTA